MLPVRRRVAEQTSFPSHVRLLPGGLAVMVYGPRSWARQFSPIPVNRLYFPDLVCFLYFFATYYISSDLSVRLVLHDISRPYVTPRPHPKSYRTNLTSPQFSGSAPMAARYFTQWGWNLTFLQCPFFRCLIPMLRRAVFTNPSPVGPSRLA